MLAHWPLRGTGSHRGGWWIMSRRIVFVLSTAVVVALAAPLVTRGTELTDATYASLRDQVLPKPAELAYRAIGWRASYWDAVVEAQELDRPILLWAMNGHPLACT